MLELSGLTHSFGAVRALDGLTFTVEPGGLFGFLGPNGAGKTTAMRIVLGLEHADAGQVRWKGSPIGPDERLRIGYLPEERGLYPKMRIADQVELFAQLYGLDHGAARTRTAAWLDRLGLADRAADAVETLSLGNQQRVQLAVALIHEPDLLLLDEPFSGLDPIAADLMRDVLQERADQGATVVFSSHQLDLVENICEDVAIIDRGHLVLEGRVDDLRRAGSRRLDVGSVDGWTPTVDGARIVGRDERFGWVKVDLADGTDPQAVLADTLRAGPVTHFAVDLEPLSEVFRHVVGRSIHEDAEPREAHADA